METIPLRPLGHSAHDQPRELLALVALVDDGEQSAQDVGLRLGETGLEHAYAARERVVSSVPADRDAAALPEDDVRVRLVEHELEVTESVVQLGKETVNDRVVMHELGPRVDDLVEAFLRIGAVRER